MSILYVPVPISVVFWLESSSGIICKVYLDYPGHFHKDMHGES